MKPTSCEASLVALQYLRGTEAVALLMEYQYNLELRMIVFLLVDNFYFGMLQVRAGLTKSAPDF